MTIKDFKKSLQNHTLEQLKSTKAELQKRLTIKHAPSEAVYLMILDDLIQEKEND